jgi:RNA polymerase sigma-70 factor (ECF subfamily)
LHDFDPSRSFRAWIFSIAWNFARDQLRRRASFGRRREGAVSLTSARGIAADEPRALEPVDRKGHTPFEALERKERSELVREALSRLDPRQRALLVLREFEGLSYEEISELSGSRVGTIKSGIHRARLELKNTLMALHPRAFEGREGKGSSNEL